jgi:hypothetical protein
MPPRARQRRCPCNHITAMQVMNRTQTKIRHLAVSIAQSINPLHDLGSNPQEQKKEQETSPHPTPTPSGACSPSTAKSRQNEIKAQGRSAFPLFPPRYPLQARSRRRRRRQSEGGKGRLPAPITKKRKSKWEALRETPRSPNPVAEPLGDVEIAKDTCASLWMHV